MLSLTSLWIHKSKKKNINNKEMISGGSIYSAVFPNIGSGIPVMLLWLVEQDRNECRKAGTTIDFSYLLTRGEGNSCALRRKEDEASKRWDAENGVNTYQILVKRENGRK